MSDEKPKKKNWVKKDAPSPKRAAFKKAAEGGPVEAVEEGAREKRRSPLYSHSKKD